MKARLIVVFWFLPLLLVAAPIILFWFGLKGFYFGVMEIGPTVLDLFSHAWDDFKAGRSLRHFERRTHPTDRG